MTGETEATWKTVRDWTIEVLIMVARTAAFALTGRPGYEKDVKRCESTITSIDGD